MYTHVIRVQALHPLPTPRLPSPRNFLYRRLKCCAGRRGTSPSIVVKATHSKRYRLCGRTHFRLLDGEEPNVCGLREIKMAALDADVDVL